jgi:hypothetical protein
MCCKIHFQPQRLQITPEKEKEQWFHFLLEAKAELAMASDVSAARKCYSEIPRPPFRRRCEQHITEYLNGIVYRSTPTGVGYE